MRRPDRTLLAGLGVALAVIAFLGLNTFGALDLRSFRLDLTENQQYSLSPASRTLLEQTEEPVTLRLYVSQAIREANPALGTYADRVHDLLDTYVELSDGRIRVEYIDPEPYSAEEDRAMGFGLRPIALDNAGSSGYLGLAGTNSTDDVDTIPVLSPDREPFLEYDLTRLVYNLAHPEKPVVALISSLPINGDPMMQYQPWQIFEQLGQFFDIRYIGGDVTSFDQDVDIVMLVHPEGLSDKTLYSIDQFVMHGGKALVFVDPNSEAGAMRRRNPQQPMPEGSASDLPKLFEGWGLKLVPEVVAGDPTYARQVQYPSGGRQQVVPYLPWMSIDGTGLNAEQVITAQLDRLNLASAGRLEATEGATTTFTPLVQTSDQAAAIPVDKVATFPDPMGLIRDYQPGGERLVLAARISGKAKSAFAGDLPEGIEAGEDRLTESAGDINVVVVADTDLLDDRSWVSSQSMLGQRVTIPVADNASFVANALDYLAGSEALASLRGREVTLRPFTLVEDVRRQAETAYRAKEQELLQRLSELQQKLASLNVAEAEAEESPPLGPDQQAAVEELRTQLIETRGELREVQHALRRDIETLRDRVRVANIAAMPALVAALALVLAIIKRLRMRRRFDTAEG